MKEQRPKRVAELIKREVSKILLSQTSDPRLKRFTIVRVEVSPDLKLAKIFISSSFAETNSEEQFKALQKALGFIKRELSKRLVIKSLPEIQFVPDSTLEKAFQVVELIKRIEKEEHKDAGNVSEGS
ncbi:30S ribosome-binding factor RbfA [Thermatribacter velox]|jgi:ribosome-binding factor A|uniref:Ribosome-binding factor A n=2 Tax=Atribacterales TaxID=2847775 RepID=A0ABZ2Y8C9_9BACT